MSEHDARRNASTINGYRRYADEMEAALKASEAARIALAEKTATANRIAAAVIKDLGEKLWNMTLKSLDASKDNDQTVAVFFPAPLHQELTAPHIDPPAHHPDHHEPHLIVAAMSLDAGLVH